MRNPDTTNEAKQGRMKKADETRDYQESMDLKAVLATPPGRRVMYRILEMAGCGVMTTEVTVYADNQIDTHGTFAELGERNLGEKLKLDWLSAAPGHFQVMMSEATVALAKQLANRQAEETKQTVEAEDDDDIT